MGEEGPWFVFGALKLRRKYIRVFERDQSQFGMSASEGLMLKIISLNPDITVTDLGKTMGYNKSLVTKNLKALVSEGYVEKEKFDGRTLTLKCTKKGWDVINFSNGNGDLFVDEIFMDCTPEERQRFMEILAKLRLD